MTHSEYDTPIFTSISKNILNTWAQVSLQTIYHWILVYVKQNWRYGSSEADKTYLPNKQTNTSQKRWGRVVQVCLNCSSLQSEQRAPALPLVWMVRKLFCLKDQQLIIHFKNTVNASEMCHFWDDQHSRSLFLSAWQGLLSSDFKKFSCKNTGF